jgi:FkbM family methyltransferase
MAGLFRRVGRWLRQYVRPLVGYWDILVLLEELRERMGRLEPTMSVSHDLLLQSNNQIIELETRLSLLATSHAQLAARGGALAAMVAAEVDRLDGYITHHAATLKDSIASMSGDLNTLKDSIASVGGDLQENVARIRGDLNPLLATTVALAGRPERAYAAPGLDVLVVAAGYDLIVPTEEAGLLTYILRHGLEAVEPGVRTVLQTHLKQGAVAVDVGANIGIHAITMALTVGPNGRVLCFEPLPHLAKTLERTLRLNGLAGRTQVHEMALADEVGEATLHRTVHGPISSLYLPPEGMGSEPILVRLATLDANFAPGARVDLVKIDVEGAEPRVWRGMRRILEDNAEIEIVLEWSASHFQRTREDPVAFMAEIRAAGFSPFRISDDGTPGPLLTPLCQDVAALEASNLLLTRCPVTQDLCQNVGDMMA